MKYSAKLPTALQLAAKIHCSDSRKGSKIPYLSHLLSVCSLVLYDGGNESEAIAALLHDALEDHPELVTRDNIKEMFGAKVLRIIESSIDTPPTYKGGKKPPWCQRKKYYIKHVSITPVKLLRISLADKLDNIRSVIKDYHACGEKIWKRFNAGKEKQLWYYKGLVDAYKKAGCRGWLFDEYVKSVDVLISLAEKA